MYQMLSLSNLVPGPNPRKIKSTESEDDQLTASIRADGLIHPITVRHKDGEQYEVMIGHRRYSALKNIYADGGDCPVPCIVTEHTNGTLETLALAENMARADMHPMDEYIAFTDLVKAGVDISTIALKFGMSERVVKQRLALGDLIPAVQQGYIDEVISLGCAMAYTLHNKKAQRRLWKEGATQEYQVKHEKFSNGIIMEYACFDHDLYTGEKFSGLFDDDEYAIDKVMFMSLQTAWLEQEAEDRLSVDSAFTAIKFDVASWEVKGYERCYGDRTPETGTIWLLNTTTGEVQELAVNVKAKTGKDKSKDDMSIDDLTAGQLQILATAMHSSIQDLSFADYLRMFFHHIHIKCNHLEAEYIDTKNRWVNTGRVNIMTAEPEWLEHAFCEAVRSAMPKNEPDPFDIKLLKEKDNKTMRDYWSPDADFLSKYNAHQLVKLAKKIKVSLKGCDKKGQKVARLAKAFADSEGLSKDWLPKRMK